LELRDNGWNIVHSFSAIMLLLNIWPHYYKFDFLDLHSEKGEWNSKDVPLPHGLTHTSKATNRCFSISLASFDRLILAPPSLSMSLSQKAQDFVSLPLSVRPSLSQKAQDFVPLSLSLCLSLAPRSLLLSIHPSLEQAL
jgi:hypothetical protein